MKRFVIMRKSFYDNFGNIKDALDNAIPGNRIDTRIRYICLAVQILNPRSYKTRSTNDSRTSWTPCKRVKTVNGIEDGCVH